MRDQGREGDLGREGTRETGNEKPREREGKGHREQRREGDLGREETRGRGNKGTRERGGARKRGNEG